MAVSRAELASEESCVVQLIWKYVSGVDEGFCVKTECGHVVVETLDTRMRARVANIGDEIDSRDCTKPVVEETGVEPLHVPRIDRSAIDLVEQSG